jgi:hypothetical protein
VRSLAEGEAVELSASTGLDVGVGAGHQGGGQATERGTVSGSGSVGVTFTRAARVERKQGKIVVTVSLSREERAALSGSAGQGVASGNVSLSGSNTRGGAMVFELDPASQTAGVQFNRIARAATVSQLQAVARDYPDTLASRTESSATARSRGAGAGVAGASLTITHAAATSQEIVHGRNRQLTGTMEGSHTGGADIAIPGGARIVRSSQTHRVRGTVSEGGDLRLDVSQSTDTSSITQSARDAADRLHTRRTEDTVAEIAAAGLGGYLRGIAERTYQRLSGYDVSQADVDVIVRRAGDERTWGRGVSSPRFYQQWMHLRRVLIDPRPPQEGLADDASPEHRAARNLYRAKVLADFMADAGPNGYAGVEYVLRFWGNYSFTDVQSQALGIHYEWPPSLSRTRARYTALRSQVTALPGRLAGLTAAQQRDGQNICLDIRLGLESVIREIEDCQDFEEPRAKMELMRVARTELSTVVTARRNFDRRFAPPGTATPAADAAAETEASARVADQTLRETLVTALRDRKREERRQLGRARAVLPASAGGTLREDGWGGFVDIFREDAREAMDAITDLRQMDLEWIVQIRALRDVLTRLDVPRGQWPVSSGPGTPRHLDLEPDIAAVRRLFETAGNRIQFYWSAGDRNQLLANFDRLRDY